MTKKEKKEKHSRKYHFSEKHSQRKNFSPKMTRTNRFWTNRFVFVFVVSLFFCRKERDS